MNALTGRLRDLFAKMADLPMLSLLGLLTGLLAAVVIIAFRELIDTIQLNLLGLGHPDGYEDLSGYMRILLASAGGVLLGLVFHYLTAPYRAVGVAHVMERLRYHQGRLSLRNGLVPASISVQRRAVCLVRAWGCPIIMSAHWWLAAQLPALRPDSTPRWQG